MLSFRPVPTLIRGTVEFLFRSHFRVSNRSMTPALESGDLLHVVPRWWRRRGFGRGSVVVARSPGDADGFLVKRVVGLPGELIAVECDGTVRIDGAALPEPYVQHADSALSRPLTWLCDENEYFLMGDNRPESRDCRWYGPLPSGSIVGEVWLTWPHRPGVKQRKGDPP